MAGSEPEDWRALQPQHLSAVANALAETHEYVLLDTPGTMNEVVAASLSEAQSVLLVTSLDVSSIKATSSAPVRSANAFTCPISGSPCSGGSA